MEIITGRFSRPILGFKSFGTNKRTNSYHGEDSIVKRLIEPVSAEGKEYSDLYMLERDKLLTLPFNWIYVINEQWLKDNKNQIFNNSYDNSPEFQEFVDNINFQVIEDFATNTKERNHLLTKIGIPFTSIDKVIVMRNYDGHFRAEHRMQDLYKNAERINHFKEFGSPADRRMPKAIEYILK
jgi:hypothetical protein